MQPHPSTLSNLRHPSNCDGHSLWRLLPLHPSLVFFFLTPPPCPSPPRSVCPDFPAVLLLVSVLFVDVGDEEEAGPLRRFQNSRERCKFLAPSISVSVPEDDPYHSDEEYYEHPLFSPEWTHSGSRPAGQAVAFRQIEGEPRMVPLCHFSPSLPSPSPSLSLSIYPLTRSVLLPSRFSITTGLLSFCDLTSFLHPSFRPPVSSSVILFPRPLRLSVFSSVSVCVPMWFYFFPVLVVTVCSQVRAISYLFGTFL